MNNTQRSKLKNTLYAFIPHHISNATLIAFLELLRSWQKLWKTDSSARLRENEKAFPRHAESIERNKGYVEDQNSYTDMFYGKASMQYSGCEIFATFNALRHSKDVPAISLPQMIAEFERDGMVLSGKFGTAPKAIADFLRRLGLRTEFVTEEEKFEELAGRSHSLILTMYNDRDDISRQVHTVNISRESGGYVAHNVYCDGRLVGPCGSVMELIGQMNGGRVKGISLIGLLREEKGGNLKGCVME